MAAAELGPVPRPSHRGTPLLSRLNAGTIPDRGTYGVHLAPDGPRIGELDEEMVYETRTGEVLTLGASSWRVEEITRDRVLVTPAPGEPGKLPFWRGDSPGRPLELGRALGELLRRLARLSRERTRDWLLAHAPLDELAAGNLADYLAEQKRITGTLPSDCSITLERFRDELGDWRLCLLTPFGARIHAPWAMALQRSLERSAGCEVQLLYTDDGIALRLADTEEPPDAGHLIPDPDEVRELILEQLPDSALFAALFRENAARSLLMPRRTGRERRPLWAQRLKSQQILGAVRRFPDFPVVMETYRQCLADLFDLFDLAGLEGILRQVRDGTLRVVEVETPAASPFARSLVFAYVAAYIYEQDAPLAERRAQALTLDRRLLGELLGQEELRALIDPGVLAQLEEELQHLTAERRAREADGAFDLLRRLGDLTLAELQQRADSNPRPWLLELNRQQRAVRLRLVGEERWIAAEDAALYRDALGALPPAGLPEAWLAPAADALPRLLHRYARTHGPFLTRELEQVVTGAEPDSSRADFESALWDLVWAGRLTNDTFAPLRARLQAPGRRRRALAGGRWSRADTPLPGDPPDTERLLARAWMLLDRYGVVSRECAAAEELPGGFGPLYAVLKELESAGRVRRGYFVEGLSGAQFAHPAAVERLRAARGAAEEGESAAPPLLWLGAGDPANPYGALLPWPACRGDDPRNGS